MSGAWTAMSDAWTGMSDAWTDMSDAWTDCRTLGLKSDAWIEVGCKYDASVCPSLEACKKSQSLNT